MVWAFAYLTLRCKNGLPLSINRQESEKHEGGEQKKLRQRVTERMPVLLMVADIQQLSQSGPKRIEKFERAE